MGTARSDSRRPGDRSLDLVPSPVGSRRAYISRFPFGVAALKDMHMLYDTHLAINQETVSERLFCRNPRHKPRRSSSPSPAANPTRRMESRILVCEVTPGAPAGKQTGVTPFSPENMSACSLSSCVGQNCRGPAISVRFVLVSDHLGSPRLRQNRATTGTAYYISTRHS